MLRQVIWCWKQHSEPLITLSSQCDEDENDEDESECIVPM